MRIRSIKPEFYTSEDIAALDWDTRLLFIGLWSYVDDNGVGRDVEQLIVAHLFPLEDDPRETLAKVSRGLQTLFGGGQITRYTVDGKPFLFVNAWEKHQKIDKPNKERYAPPTSANAVIRESVARVSRVSREDVAPGTGEQGNRGTEDLPVVTFSNEVKVSNARDDEAAPTIQEETRSAPVELSVMKVVRIYTSQVTPSDAGKIAAQVTNACKDWTLDAIGTALGNLAADRRPVTADTLRIELDNLELPDKHGVIHYRNGSTKEVATGILRTRTGQIVGGGGLGTGRPMWREG